MAWKRPAFAKVEGHRKLPEKASFEREAEVEVRAESEGARTGPELLQATPRRLVAPHHRLHASPAPHVLSETARADSTSEPPGHSVSSARRMTWQKGQGQASAGSAARARSLDTRARGHGQVTGDEGDLAGRDPDAGLHVQRDCPHHAVLRRRVQGERTRRLPGGASAAHAARTCPQPACVAL